MKMNKLAWTKIIALAVVCVAMAIAGFMFHEHRTFKEPVVVSEHITEVKKLSDYSDVVKGTVNDSNVYIFDSGVPGGTILIYGRSHPEEPAGVMACELLVENLNVTMGRVFIIDSMNNSGSTNSRVGEAYPRFFNYETEWGTKTWRYGDRAGNQLDSWPDPEVYLQYPSGQSLANVDIRNINRNWPGKADGLVTERTAYAVMEMIRQEGINMVIDMHEAELEYSVENTIVVHESGQDVAAMAAMMLTADPFEVAMGMEFSPKALHGLSHREIGDYSDAVPYEFEVAEPMLDRIRGITDEELLMSGKDRFVMLAGEHNLLYAPIDESGWPIEVRVARHVTAALKIIEINNMVHFDQMIMVEGIPTYQEMKESLAPYYHDPSSVSADRVYYD